MTVYVAHFIHKMILEFWMEKASLISPTKTLQQLVLTFLMTSAGIGYVLCIPMNIERNDTCEYFAIGVLLLAVWIFKICTLVIKSER